MKFMKVITSWKTHGMPIGFDTTHGNFFYTFFSSSLKILSTWVVPKAIRNVWVVVVVVVIVFVVWEW